MLKYYIVFPRGNREKLSIVSIDDSMLYELHDYAVASRESFYDVEEVIKYGKELASKHGLPLSSLDEDIERELRYLD